MDTRKRAVSLLLFGILASPLLASVPALPEVSGFVPACGRLPEEFIYTSSGFHVRFSPQSIEVYTKAGSAHIDYIGANKTPQLKVEQSSTVRVNYVFGGLGANCADLPAFRYLSYTGLYDGIDVRYEARTGGMESEYRIAAHTDPDRLRISYSAVSSKRIDAGGALELNMLKGVWREHPPRAWQFDRDGSQVPVKVMWRLNKDGTVGFLLGSYNRNSAVVIDPTITFNTNVSNASASGVSAATGIATDANGNIYVAGWIEGSNLGQSVGQSSNRGSVDAFLMKLNASGALVFATYFGGTDDDRAFALTLDSSGRPWITGETCSSDLPVASAFQPSSGGNRNAFVAEFSNSGNLIFASYLGGTGPDSGNAIAADSSGNIYVAGDTQSANFPVHNAAQIHYGGGQDAFVTKISSAGSLMYSTFLGGSGSDHGGAVAVDGSGAAYVTGGTFSADFPVTKGAFQATIKGSADAFVTKLNAAGNGVIYSTYLGGSAGSILNQEQGNAITVDSAGNALIGGVTPSSDFPVMNPVQSKYGGNWDGFVAKLNTAGTALLYSTYLGGSGMDVVTAITVDAFGAICVVGYTYSMDFPSFIPTQARAGGLFDSFVTVYNPQGSALYYSTLIGGSSSDAANAVAIGTKDEILVAGQTRSLDYPLVSSLGNTHSGGLDTFVAKISTDSFIPRGTTYLGWQNDSTRSVGISYLSGTNVLITDYPAPGNYQGWSLVGVADMNRDGVPDLIWQNDMTRQVGVWYMTGPHGTVLLGTAYPAPGNYPGWKVVSVHDMNGDGVPDLVWQNDTTRAVGIWYLTGPQATQVSSIVMIAPGTYPGWTLVGIADMDGNGVADLVWQNDTTRSVGVWYMSSASGLLAIAYPAPGTYPGWKVVGIADIDGNGIPDLIWQNDSTRAVGMWFLDGPIGTTLLGTTMIAPGSYPQGLRAVGMK